MDILLIFLGASIVGLLIYLILQLKTSQKPETDASQKLMLEVIENLRKSLQDSDGKNRKELQDRFDKITEYLTQHQHRSLETMQKQFGQSAKIIEEVTKKLTQLDETNKQVVGFAEQMKSLENILKNPKHRGILGEYLLETLLGNVLAPSQYQMQYSFRGSEKGKEENKKIIVDAVIFIDKKIIPVDAKFSLEKYNRLMQENDVAKRDLLEKEFKSDLKQRIDETAKYINPQQNTADFAFMFIPAEGIFHHLLIYNVGTLDINTQDLIEYAFKKRVIIVSPSSFFAYLQTVLQGLKALKIESSMQEIIKRVGDLGRHLNSYEEFIVKLGNNLGSTVNMYNKAAVEFKKIDKDVYKITDGESGGIAEIAQLAERPQVVD